MTWDMGVEKNSDMGHALLLNFICDMKKDKQLQHCHFLKLTCDNVDIS